MARHLPPLNPLRVFEAVARHKNLTLAAKELCVTQSAVSRQIANLETYVGTALIMRESRGVTLTRAGLRYAQDILPAFDILAEATGKVMEKNAQSVLRVRTYTTFTAKWLIPHLMHFRQRYPDIEVLITNAVPTVDFDRDGVDIAIQYGEGNWPGTQSDLLFRDELEPICSPQFLAAHPESRHDPAVLLKGPLLFSHYRRSDWDDWLRFADLETVAQKAERMSFSTSVLTWQAAMDGLGLAVGQIPLLKSELESGLLVRPFARPQYRDKGHYLVRPSLQRHSRKVTAFRNWILHEVGHADENLI
ncbi:MAG TPA: transcriptional regulator GcvA [Advenella sp.]|nr:transcriptional regulator GcvA [Advenella sp.]